MEWENQGSEAQVPWGSGASGQQRSPPELAAGLGVVMGGFQPCELQSQNLTAATLGEQEFWGTKTTFLKSILGAPGGVCSLGVQGAAAGATAGPAAAWRLGGRGSRPVLWAPCRPRGVRTGRERSQTQPLLWWALVNARLSCWPWALGVCTLVWEPEVLH